MAAGNDAKRSSIARQWIEIECDLYVHRVFEFMSTVRVPPCIADIEIPVAAHIVEIVTEQRLRNSEDSRIVQQGTQLFVLINKWNDTGTSRAFMRFTVMTAASLLPDGFKSVLNRCDPVCHQLWETEVTERLEKINFRIGDSEILLIHL